LLYCFLTVLQTVPSQCGTDRKACPISRLREAGAENHARRVFSQRGVVLSPGVV